MNNISVTVFQDRRGFNEAGYVKSIPVGGVTVIGVEKIFYGPMPECVTDAAQSVKNLLHVNVAGLGSIWVDETANSFMEKMNPGCCSSGSGSQSVVLEGGDISGGGTIVTLDELAGVPANAILVNDVPKSRGVGYTKNLADDFLTFTDGTTVSATTTIVIF